MSNDDKSFSEFVRQCWLKDKDLDYDWHLSEMAKHLERIAAGNAPRMLINHPRQYHRPRPLSLPDDD
jgi:hypothetical protein